MKLLRNNIIGRKQPWHSFGRIVGVAFVAVVVFTVSSPFVKAQSDPDESAPPPVRAISRDEGIALKRETDVKSRTLVALDLMNARISAAEKAAALQEFEQMYTELGGFLGVIDNTIEFLSNSDSNNSKVLGNFKRFEIGLRGFVPRIELIRRELPLRYEPFVKSTIKYIRDARSRALEPLFGDKVVREPRIN